METRPGAEADLLASGEPRDSSWTEIVIAPHDPRMLREGEEWLQWVEEECVVISLFRHWVMGLLWPVLFRLYTRKLVGQRT